MKRRRSVGFSRSVTVTTRFSAAATKKKCFKPAIRSDVCSGVMNIWWIAVIILSQFGMEARAEPVLRSNMQGNAGKKSFKSIR